MMYYYGNYGSFWPFHFFGSIAMVAFWVLVVAGIVWLVRQPSSHSSAGNSSSLEILKNRYAKGELTKEQFESMKKDIDA